MAELTHPVTGQTIEAVAFELIRATIRARRKNATAYAGLSNKSHAQRDAELLARRARTQELRDFYAAVAAHLLEE